MCLGVCTINRGGESPEDLKKALAITQETLHRGGTPFDLQEVLAVLATKSPDQCLELRTTVAAHLGNIDDIHECVRRAVTKSSHLRTRLEYLVYGGFAAAATSGVIWSALLFNDSVSFETSFFGNAASVAALCCGTRILFNKLKKLNTVLYSAPYAEYLSISTHAQMDNFLRALRKRFNIDTASSIDLDTVPPV